MKKYVILLIGLTLVLLSTTGIYMYTSKVHADGAWIRFVCMRDGDYYDVYCLDIDKEGKAIATIGDGAYTIDANPFFTRTICREESLLSEEEMTRLGHIVMCVLDFEEWPLYDGNCYDQNGKSLYTVYDAYGHYFLIDGKKYGYTVDEVMVPERDLLLQALSIELGRISPLAIPDEYLSIKKHHDGVEW